MDFHATHQAALKIAGTVALPSPFPACGSLSIVVAPEDGDYETYLRIVQPVTGKRIITRFVRLADVRALRAPETAEAPGARKPGRSSVPKKFSAGSPRRRKSFAPRQRNPGARANLNGFPRRSCMFPRPRRCCIATTSG